MKIEILDKYRGNTVIITTPDDNPDERVNPSYDGESQQVNVIKRLLRQNYGAYGHIVDPDDTNNLDLQVAAQKLPTERFIVAFLPILTIPPVGDGKVS